MWASREPRQAPDLSGQGNGGGGEWAPPKLSWVPKCLLALQGRDQGAERRCAGRSA